METEVLKAYVAAKMREYYPKGKLWPNGLGFEYRGWSFSYGEREQRWFASKEQKGRVARGQGDNPFDAYAHARPVQE